MDDSKPNDETNEAPPQKINWRGPIVTLTVVPLLIVFFQFCGEAAFQWGRGYRWLASEASFWAGILALIFWMGVRSGFSPRVRRIGSLVPLISLVAFFTIFQLKRTGDLIPYGIKFRFAKSAVDGDSENVKPTDNVEIPVDDGPQFAFHQFLGPNRDGIIRGVRLERDWKKHPPRELWRQPIGGGFSSFAIVDKFAFTQELRGDQECVTCYELLTGKTVWRRKTKDNYRSAIAGDGPRATPTIDGDHLFAVGGEGWLYCLKVANGDVVWSKNIFEPYGAGNNKFGKSCSPLVVDDKLIVTGGANKGPTLLAFNKNDGELIWEASWPKSKEPGTNIYNAYDSPVLATLHDVPQILNIDDNSVAGYAAETGKQLWTFEWPWIDTEPRVTQPVVLPSNRIFISAAYASGSGVFQVIRNEDGSFKAVKEWDNRRLKTKFSNVVVRDGYVFGLHDRVMACLNLKDGQRVWAKGRYGHGQIIMVEDVILVVGEMGEVALVEATPDGHNEIGRFQALNDRTWNSPALMVPNEKQDVVYLLLRNDQEAMCYELRRKP